MCFEGLTGTSIKYGICNHRYDLVDRSFIETNFIPSVVQLTHTLFYLFYSAYFGWSIALCLGVSGLYAFSGVAAILAVAMFSAAMYREHDLVCSVYAIPACLCNLALLPFVTAINMFSFMNNTVFCSMYYLMDCFETRSEIACLSVYLNENPEIEHIKLH